MLLQITQLTEDDSYEYGDGTEPSDFTKLSSAEFFANEMMAES